jgi:hypothetical protein
LNDFLALLRQYTTPTFEFEFSKQVHCQGAGIRKGAIPVITGEVAARVSDLFCSLARKMLTTAMYANATQPVGAIPV